MARAHKVKNNIRQLRKARGLTQEDLATRIGVHFTTIAKIERAERGLSLNMLAAISNALGVVPRDILNDDMFKAPPRMRMVPLLGDVSPVHWREALHDPDGTFPVPDAGENAFAVTPEASTVDLLVGPGAVLVVDPDDVDLKDGRVYAVLNVKEKSTFRRFQAEPLRLDPLSSDPDEQPLLLGREPFTIIGRVVWQASPL